MIKAIFNKSKPINLIFTSLMLLFGFLLMMLKSEQSGQSSLLNSVLVIFLAILSALLTDFIVKRNKLSGQNSFVVFFFSLFFFYFWGANNDSSLLFANFFILLALRKIISLKSQITITKKIFDAGICIAVASLFYFWSILFFIVLYFGIAIYAANYLKNWLVPVLGVFVVCINMTAYELVVNNQFFDLLTGVIDTNFNLLNNKVNGVIVGFFLMISIVSILFLPSRTRLMLQKNKLSYFVLIVALLVAVVLFLIAPNKSKETLLFLYFPLAVVFTCFFEKIKNPLIKSLVLYSMILISVVLCLLSS